MSNLVQYEQWSPEDAVGEAEAVAAAAESGNYWKPKAGDNRIRLLPTRRGLHPAPFVVTWNHYIEIPGKENGIPFNCPRKHKAGHPCPACIRADELRQTGNPADYKAAGMFIPKLRVYANIIDRKNPDEGPRVFAFGKTVYDPLMSYRSKDPDQDEPFTNLDDTGCDVLIRKTGEKKETKYEVRLAKTHTPAGPDAAQVREWMEALRDLRPEAKILTVDQIRAKLRGDEDGTGRRAQPGNRARSVVDDMSGDDAYELHPDD